MNLRRKVVVKKSEFVCGSPMEAWPGVKDWKLVYPETGTEARTLIRPWAVSCSSDWCRGGPRPVP
ncbi:MAG: hypothetical protein ACE5JU_14675 [Candidatus Binatia bacterium]